MTMNERRNPDRVEQERVARKEFFDLLGETSRRIAALNEWEPMTVGEFERRKALPNVSQFDEPTSSPYSPCNPP